MVQIIKPGILIQPVFLLFKLPEELTLKDITDDTKIIRDSLLTIIHKLKDLN